MSRQLVVALDVGSSKVACVIGRLVNLAELPAQSRAGSVGAELVGHGLASYPLGAWPPEPSVVAECIERALEETRVTDLPDRVTVTLSHPHVAHTQVTAQLDLADEPVTVRVRDLHRLRKHAIAQALGLDRDALLLEAIGYSGNGFEGIRNPTGLVATRLHGTFQLVSLPLNVRRMITQALELLGLELDQLIYSLHALAASQLSIDPAGQVLLIDVGGSCTDMAMLRHGHLVRSDTIAWGGQTVLDAVATACRLTRDQALPMSLEGLASATPTVRRVMEEQVRALREPLHRLLQASSVPSLAVVTGRGALMDGLVEWVETMTGIPATLGRSAQAKELGDVARQVALSSALGALELAARARQRPRFSRASSPRLFDRLLDRTKRILVEYF